MHPYRAKMVLKMKDSNFRLTLNKKLGELMFQFITFYNHFLYNTKICWQYQPTN